jgi:hypothetical protein
LPAAAGKPSRTESTLRPALAAFAALALAWLPTSVSDLAAAEPADLIFVQDTIPARQDTTRARPPRPERDPEQLPDSLAADTLSELAEPFPAPDSLMQELMLRPGYRPVVYRGDTLQFSTQDRTIHIQERANIEREGEQLYADSVVYQGESRFVTAYGKSKLINADGEEVDSESGPVYYDTDRKVGKFVGGRTRWEVWNVAGDFTLEGTDTLWVEDGHFTSCDLPEPHYRFEADKIKLVLGHIVVAWPVRLYFGDVPVFWFPFMAQDIRRGRHSGILTLRFGVNDIVRNSSGHSRHISDVGYFWAISDYMDAQLSLDWWSDTWTRIDGFYRYRWREKFVNGRLGYSHFFLPDGSREISLAWNHSQRFGERADLRASIQFVSSQQFQREAEFNPERLTQQLRSDLGYTRRFDWGTLTMSGQRVQPLSNPDTIGAQPTTTSFPAFSITLQPIQLTPARSPLEAKWYSGLTWTGSTNFSRTLSQTPTAPDVSNISSGLTSNLTLNNLRWNSSGSYREQVIEKPDTLVPPDTVIIGPDTTITSALVIGPEVRAGTASWRTSLGYQQRLIGSTTLTPGLSMDGGFFRSNETGLNFVATPTRMSLNASLNSDIYGFFPGGGSVERIRHKFSPSLSWSYSPAVTPSAELEGLIGFRADSVRERHTLSLGLQQTFEAKIKPRQELPDSLDGEQTDSLTALQADSLANRQDAEPRKMILLAIRTTMLTYDLVEKELVTSSLSNTMTSDLLRGLTLRITHDLFEVTDGNRRFDLFLTQLNLNFSLGDRTLAGLFGDDDPLRSGRGIVPQSRDMDLEEEEFPDRGADYVEEPESRGPSRSWNLSVDYSLLRNRPKEGLTVPNRQSVRTNLRFQPTENWVLTWRTQYDIENGRFVDHALSLRRELHRWSATFEFLRASNGNFLFSFFVNLNDLRDVKFDYRQETRK